jgi:hypothetical protein
MKRLVIALLPLLAMFSRLHAQEPVAPRGDSPFPEAIGVARIRPALPMGSVSGFWNVDRQYRDAPTLKPRSRVTVAELKGPGVITLLRLSQVPQIQKAGLLRGLVIEITFDDAPEPAVLCPVPDFFGDGANGQSAHFASSFIEKVPEAWNAYFPMPFARSARVVFRNDTDVDTMAYTYLEWQALPAWPADLGYFHATWRRRAFRLNNDTREEFWRTKGRGHFLGRQFTIASDEARFAGFGFVMEGNNEVDIDGRPRAFDYLGSEDSFTFSWGFNRVFASPRAGMTHLTMDGARSRLSIYRFHDHMPIRFDREIVWTINWRTEDPGFGKQSGWVDYATVFYWYQDRPGAYRHEPLPLVSERCRDLLPAPETLPDLTTAFASLPLDPRPTNAFEAEEDLRRVAVLQAYPNTHPFWIDVPEPKGGHPGNPHPGRRGILAVHAEEKDVPAIVMWKVALPPGARSSLRVVVSGDPYEGPGKSDFLLQPGVFAGTEVRWLGEPVVIDAGEPSSGPGWQTLVMPLPPELAGQTVGILLKVAYGGPKGVMNEEAFLDEIAIVPDR